MVDVSRLFGVLILGRWNDASQRADQEIDRDPSFVRPRLSMTIGYLVAKVEKTMHHYRRDLRDGIQRLETIDTSMPG